MLPTELRLPFSKVIVQFTHKTKQRRGRCGEGVISVSKVVTDTTFCKKTAPEATEEA